MSNPAKPIEPRRRAPVPMDQCGLVHAAELIGDRWTLLILREAFYGVRRFDDLQADLGAPRQALTDRLTRLVDLGLMARRPYREPGQRERFEYHPTRKIRALIPALMGLGQWGEAEAGLEPTVAFRRRDTGAPLHLALVDADGLAAPLEVIQAIVLATGEPI